MIVVFMDHEDHSLFHKEHRLRYRANLIEQLKKDYTYYMELMGKLTNKTISKEEKQEFIRVLSYLKKEMRMIKKTDCGIEGLTCCRIKDIEHDLQQFLFL